MNQPSWNPNQHPPQHPGWPGSPQAAQARWPGTSAATPQRKQSSAAVVLIVLVVLGLLGALLVAGMWRWMRVATDEEEAVVQQYVDAVNSGRFEAARKLMLHPERESKAAFERAAHQQVFRRTRQIAFVGFDKVTIDDDSTTCLNVEADRELFHFELVGRGGNWKIRVAAQPGVCAGTWVRGTAPGDRP